MRTDDEDEGRMDIDRALGRAAELQDAGRVGEAEAIYREVLASERDPYAAHLLGMIELGRGRDDAALPLLREAADADPECGPFLEGLGRGLAAAGDAGGAIAALARAVGLEPDLASAHELLGELHERQRDFARAIPARAALARLRPTDAMAHYLLGYALSRDEQVDAAVDALEAAVRLKPDFAEAHYHLGGARRLLGLHDPALECYRRAMELRPDQPAMHSSYAMAVHFHPDFDAAAILREQRAWDERHGRPLRAAIAPHANDRTPGRRLRVGYVSPYLRAHVIGQWILPLLQSHDRASVEVVAYSDARDAPSQMTDTLRAACDLWRDTADLSDERLADAVRADRVDILVDLTMHMGNNRLPAFARKPAPVQVTYLAYPSTTGLKAMDYRLTDPYLDPPGQRDELYSERSVRLPETWCCYRPTMSRAADPGPPPMLAAGHATFGCLNNFSKVTPAAVAAWCAVLRAVPGSRLLLHGREGRLRDRAAAEVRAHGIDPARVEFVGLLPIADYFAQYRRIDVALDPIPYGGGTTTCDGLWMGVPVVSLVGQTAVSRSGLTLLSNVGLPRLAVDSVDAYVRAAAALAGDPAALRTLRAGLRERMLRSPLMDAPRFARNVEAAYRRMWEEWCRRT